MHSKGRRRLGIVILLATCAFCLHFLWSIDGGARLTSLSLRDIFQPSHNENIDQIILWQLRLPRSLVAALVGLILGCSGTLCQGIFRNPLASPSILGATSGAGLFVAVATLIQWNLNHWFMVPMMAALGALTATLTLFTIAGRSQNHTSENLLLGGFAMSAMLSAMTTLTITLILEKTPNAPGILYWLMGSFSSASWHHVIILTLATVILFLGSFRVTSQLDILNTGELVARSLGISIERLRWATILLFSLGVGSVVAVAGPIPFVGLMAPHIARQLFGPKHKFLIFYAGTVGMLLTLTCDLISKSWRAPAETQVGILLAVIGGPFFLWIWIKQKERAPS